MKTVGLIGGSSFESTVEYYRLINEIARSTLGGVHSAEILMVSVDFQNEVCNAINPKWKNVYFPKHKTLCKTRADYFGDALGGWKLLAHRIKANAEMLRENGAEIVLICSCTLHRCLEFVDIPSILSIGKAVSERIKLIELETEKEVWGKIALLGTGITMRENFLKNEIQKFSQKEVIVPTGNEMDFIDNAIFNEMCKGNFFPETRKRFLEIISNLKQRGANTVVLGCTEIPILLKDVEVQDHPLAFIDAMGAHCTSAMTRALKRSVNSPT